MKGYFISFLSQILENWDLNLWLILSIHYGAKLLNRIFSFIPGFIFSPHSSFFLPHFKLTLFHHTWSTPFVNKTQHKCCFICLQFSYYFPTLCLLLPALEFIHLYICCLSPILSTLECKLQEAKGFVLFTAISLESRTMFTSLLIILTNGMMMKTDQFCLMPYCYIIELFLN